jgi:hypothetical protein
MQFTSIILSSILYFLHLSYFLTLQNFGLSRLFFLFLKLMLTITNHTLEKLELLLKNTGYSVRYEKGNFKTGACLLQNSKVIVVNKFSGLESKILSISELARDLEMDYNLLDEKQIAFHQQLKQMKLEL